MTPSVARSVLATIRAGAPAVDPGRYGLSEREAEVLRALVSGKGYKEIAFDLHISVDTVRTHIRKVYGKLQVHSAPEAVARAIRERIVSANSSRRKLWSEPATSFRNRLLSTMRKS